MSLLLLFQPNLNAAVLPGPALYLMQQPETVYPSQQEDTAIELDQDSTQITLE